jgi:hypothetical protein
VGRREVCGLLTALLMLVLTGCLYTPPRFADGTSMPAEVRRVPLPAAAPDGSWAVFASWSRLIGQGRTLTQLPPREGDIGPRKSWTLRLPQEFALTSRTPGTAHSLRLDRLTALLVGGRAGRTGPTAVAGLDRARGVLSWQRQLPDHTKVFLVSDRAVAATCAPRSCRFTAWDAATGTQLWTRQIPGRLRAVDTCGADGFGRQQEQYQDCRPYVVAQKWAGFVSTADGTPFPLPGVHPPAGTVDRVDVRGSRMVMITAPAEGTCRSTVVASEGETGGIKDSDWRYDFVWDQPQVAREPHTGCRWDRTQPLSYGSPTYRYRTVLPNAAGAEAFDLYASPPQAGRRLARGTYLVGTGPDAIARTPGKPDYTLNDDLPDRTHVQKILGPHARQVDGDLWQAGRQLVLIGYDGKVRWRRESDCEAFTLPALNEAAYCDGRDLVDVKPAD